MSKLNCKFRLAIRQVTTSLLGARDIAPPLPPPVNMASALATSTNLTRSSLKLSPLH